MLEGKGQSQEEILLLGDFLEGEVEIMGGGMEREMPVVGFFESGFQL